MKLNQVLVTYKKPSKLRGAVKGTALARLKRTSPDLFRRSLEQQKSHRATIRHVLTVLRELGIHYKEILREKLETHYPSPPPRLPADALVAGRGRAREGVTRIDLIISIGGDGSVLAASHVAGSAPILGVNSLPKTSIGFFCAANAVTFRKKLTEILKGRPTLLPLLEVSIDGKKIPFPALNDILFASSSPAETVQYTIQVGKRKERQRGSGVWIAAGPGSTAGIRSAGGRPSAITSRRIQYLARELCPIPKTRYRLRKGFIPKGGSLKIVSEMSQGMAFIDGTRLAYPVCRGSVLKVRISPKKLKIFL